MKAILLCILAFSFSSLLGQHAVTYQQIDTRFGDQVLNYLHAKWLAYYYHIPLFYRPFEYSSELIMDERESALREAFEFQNSMDLTNFAQPTYSNLPTLFIVPYFPETEYELMDCPFHFPVDWKNEEFRKTALKMISPKKKLQLIQPPSNEISIALHIREGGGFDGPRLHIDFPIKSPPLMFYIISLLKVLKHFNSKPIYCYIFTDAKYPKKIVDLIKRMMPSDTQITFDYRKENNGPNAHVLEDFFSLFLFDVLIRPGSNYSIVPSLLHDYAILCYPLSFSIVNDIVTIEEVKIEINDELYKKCLEKCSQNEVL